MGLLAMSAGGIGLRTPRGGGGGPPRACLAVQGLRDIVVTNNTKPEDNTKPEGLCINSPGVAPVIHGQPRLDVKLEAVGVLERLVRPLGEELVGFAPHLHLN